MAVAPIVRQVAAGVHASVPVAPTATTRRARILRRRASRFRIIVEHRFVKDENECPSS